MDDRRRLFERVYSREGAEEEPREYRDPLTGATVRMTPSQWALAEYDRLHPQASADDEKAQEHRDSLGRADPNMPTGSDDGGGGFIARTLDP